MSALKTSVAIKLLARINIYIGTTISQKIIEFLRGQVVTCVDLTWNDPLLIITILLLSINNDETSKNIVLSFQRTVHKS
jgi:hypothetical protein